jgi:NADH-quinone oxidoreductase subunit M
VDLIIFSNVEIIAIKLLLFFGFGIKIPIWPFHFWLTKTHVEVNTSFSIFLSGVLVKIALYGIYKFNFFFKDVNYIFILISVLGVIDASIKFFSQVDIKKIVAYCTIFEMNIMLLILLFLTYNSYLFLIYFCILHTLLSFYFFFLVDCIFKRFNTRSIFGINNIINLFPNLAIFTIVGVLLFNGLPLTLKFNLELVLIQKLLNFNFLYFFIFFFIQIFAIIFITKNFFIIIFSSNSKTQLSDLTSREFFLFFYLISFFILFSFI